MQRRSANPGLSIRPNVVWIRKLGSLHHDTCLGGPGIYAIPSIGHGWITAHSAMSGTLSTRGCRGSPG